MPCSREADSGAWAAIGPDSMLEALLPLRDEHRRRGIASLVPGDVNDIDRIVGALDHPRATLLILEDPERESGRSRYRSPFITRTGRPDVLVGWVRLGTSTLARYASRAAALLRRLHDAAPPVVLLAPREQRYLDLLDELERAVECMPGVTALRWSAERIRRPRLIDALRSGIAAVLYTGHGTSEGWFAYGGLTLRAFGSEDEWTCDLASGLLFSLSCGTGRPSAPAGHDPAASGFADGLVAHGVAGAVLAPLGDTLHAANRTLATALMRALGTGRRQCRDVLEAARLSGASLEGYAVIGDPALSAVAAAGAAQRAASVFAPAAHADLSGSRFRA